MCLIAQQQLTSYYCTLEGLQAQLKHLQTTPDKCRDQTTYFPTWVECRTVCSVVVVNQISQREISEPKNTYFFLRNSLTRSITPPSVERMEAVTVINVPSHGNLKSRKRRFSPHELTENINVCNTNKTKDIISMLTSLTKLLYSPRVDDLQKLKGLREKKTKQSFFCLGNQSGCAAQYWINFNSQQVSFN